jgi:hypothetical protein
VSCVYYFVKASFYQNDALFDYSIKMSGFMPILGLMYRCIQGGM